MSQTPSALPVEALGQAKAASWCVATSCPGIPFPRQCPAISAKSGAKSSNTHVHGVRALLSDARDGTHSSWGKHDLVVVHKRVLVDRAKDVTASNVVADAELGGVEVPLDVAGEGLCVDTSRNVDGLGLLLDGLQRSLNTTETSARPRSDVRS